VASEELNDLVEKGILIKKGKGGPYITFSGKRLALEKKRRVK